MTVMMTWMTSCKHGDNYGCDLSTKRIAKSEAARAKRHKLKDTLFECALRKFQRLRKLRRLGKRNTTI